MPEKLHPSPPLPSRPSLDSTILCRAAPCSDLPEIISSRFSLLAFLTCKVLTNLPLELYPSGSSDPQSERGNGAVETDHLLALQTYALLRLLEREGRDERRGSKGTDWALHEFICALSRGHFLKENGALDALFPLAEKSLSVSGGSALSPRLFAVSLLWAATEILKDFQEASPDVRAHVSPPALDGGAFTFDFLPPASASAHKEKLKKARSVYGDTLKTLNISPTSSHLVTLGLVSPGQPRAQREKGVAGAEESNSKTKSKKPVEKETENTDATNGGSKGPKPPNGPSKRGNQKKGPQPGPAADMGPSPEDLAKEREERKAVADTVAVLSVPKRPFSEVPPAPTRSEASKFEKALGEHFKKGGLKVSLARVPCNYYEDMELAHRRHLLGAPSVGHLCKTVVMENTAHTGEEGNPRNARFYAVVVQYIARVNCERVKDLVKSLNPPGKLGNKKLNFNFAKEEMSAELTGFKYNAVTPFLMRTPIPVLLSHHITRLDPPVIWLGGGEVDLKLGISLDDFVGELSPFVGSVTFPVGS
uniref:YbaK/aminoacyl-tRNA synthetase-associated domain-containing protein n=1 Tax=Chromera velia CCMP2878 TaxID=1169474 RepID=A0A0G4GQT2_9ALVE|mmetsp:Transcript_11106/g.21442  ORF Transcript_11106/g.21442 Transcript_11106/m.21442 type:complete len:534 (-) Transcript_11106:361-1962(-)|eukprot:Cvel_22964.t1-p1 / transcript=Cvel_22964.t1 / gene=Cvel_22964 / organism=Chromera_velia_CCMP2878 / gene_product=hypothetical protein / transcript_product=hypothetical protein / location=Cvel_scaffold2314:7113-11845(+) / protein_length=533 / sequence_SO=supercontig / SO=protein_coding / is_pseudo=false